MIRVALFLAGFLLGIFVFTPLPFIQGKLTSTNSVQFFDIHHTRFYESFLSGSGYHEFVPLSTIPNFVQDAAVMLEDKRFFSHFGFDPIAIVRASEQNFQARRVVSGGSGITQQLIRNHLQAKQRGITYKLQELILAIKTEMFFSKPEILEAYLNSVYYGENAHGIASASRIFFNKTPQELSIREAIFLSGLPQSPSVYSPLNKPQNALKREKTVTKILDHNGFFQKYCQDKKCLDVPIIFDSDEIQRTAPHYIEETEKELKQILPNLEKHHIEVETYFDAGLYAQIENILQQKREELAEKNIHNAAIVVLNHENRGVSALIGSLDYFDPKIHGFVDNAVSFRQAGSTMKPFTYALAFERGDTPDSIVDDSFLHMTTQQGLPYEPKNYDFEEYGNVTYRQALSNSYNISAIKIAEKVGVKNVLNTLQALGFKMTKSADHYGAAITLGDGDIRLLDLTNAYTVFPLQGKKYPFKFIKRVFVDGKLAYERPAESGERIFSQQSAEFISDILSDNEARSQQFGTDSPLKTSLWSAAKTGTTRNYRDNWTIGFTHENTVGVWVGNSDGSYLKNSSGITGAAPIWHDIVEALPRGELRTQSSELRTNTKYQIPNIKKTSSPRLSDSQTHGLSASTIISPQNGDIFLLEGSPQDAIILKAKKSLTWTLDGKPFGTGEKLFWEEPTLGIHCVEGNGVKKCFEVKE